MSVVTVGRVFDQIGTFNSNRRGNRKSSDSARTLNRTHTAHGSHPNMLSGMDRTAKKLNVACQGHARTSVTTNCTAQSVEFTEFKRCSVLCS